MVEVDGTADMEPPEPWPWLDESRLAREHPTIFHYTRLKVLPQILESGGVFATRYNVTNDPDELHSLRHPLAAMMAMSALPLLKYAETLGHFRPPQDMDIEAVALDEAIKFHDIMVRSLPKPLPCLTCFCTHSEEHHVRNGLLTMWRLYGRGEGVALGFDTAKFVALTEEIQKTRAVAGIYLDRVLYGLQDPELTTRVLQSPDVVQQFARTLMVMLREKSEMGPISKSTLTKFLRLICCSKHPDFSDEREVRLVVQEAFIGKELGRPRLDQSLPDRVLVQYLGALKEVMVGPGELQSDAVAMVRHALNDNGFPDIPVIASGTQFRFV